MLDDVRRSPHLGLLVSEPARAALDMGLMLAATPWLAAARRGDGHGVLVLPGLLASDGSTVTLRAFLRRRGYTVRGWRLGRNLGPRESVVDGLAGGLHSLADHTGGAVSIIGWSLGGIFARGLALDHPHLVRQVITLGSPFRISEGHRTRADRTYASLSVLHARETRMRAAADYGSALRVPTTSVYSRLDGIVGWRACLDEPTPIHQNVEVRCSHLGFGFDPATVWVVADRLAQREDRWEPFEAPPALRRLYGRIS